VVLVTFTSFMDLSCSVTVQYDAYRTFIYFFVALRPNAGNGLLVLEVSRSLTMKHHSR